MDWAILMSIVESRKKKKTYLSSLKDFEISRFENSKIWKFNIYSYKNLKIDKKKIKTCEI